MQKYMGNVCVLFKDGHVVYNENRIEKADVLVKEGKIAAIGKNVPIEAGTRIIDISGKYLLPGFVNTHTHLFQSMLKGLGKDLPLMGWLAASIRPNAPKFTEEDFYYATLLAAMGIVTSGGTTVMDFMYANENPEAASAVCRALDDLGIRAVLGRGFIDRRLEDENHNRLVETPVQILGQVDRLKDYTKDMSRVNVGIAGSVFWGITENGFEAIRDYAQTHDVVVALHASETVDDNNDSIDRFGIRMFPYLHKIGFLQPWLTAVHCVTLDEQDIELIAANDVKVSYNPQSNMILGSGIPPMVSIQEKGVTIGLGSDGAASNDSQDMIETMKFASLLQKAACQDPTVFAANDVFGMATTGGAVCCGLQDKVGRIEVGMEGDLVVYNPDRIKSAPVYNPVTSLVYSSDCNNVETVMVEGKIIYDHYKFVHFDADVIVGWVKSIQEKFAAYQY